jgi:hypothetical protein
MGLLPESKELVSFVSSKCGAIDVEPLDESSQSLFTEFFKLLTLAENEFSKLTLTTRTMYGVKGDMFEHIPAPIRNTISDSDRMDNFTFVFKHRTVNVYMTHVPNIRKYMKKIYLWFYMVDNFPSAKCSTNINVYIHLTPFTKRVPTDGSPIDQINANTAFTTFCSPSTDIHIYRMEEWLKVLIHESFHNLGLEFSKFITDYINRVILGMFPVKSQVNLGESYAEIWAELINCCIVSYSAARDKTNHAGMLSRLDKLLDIETKFSLVQCAKVLRHNRMKYSDFFSASNSARQLYTENTNVLSYYVIKSILMFNKNEFIAWCVSNNKNPLDFNKTPANIYRYCELIRKLHRTPGFMQNITAAASVRGHEHTLRMTAIEN